MANGYMPRKDADALTFMQNFARGLSLHYAVYGVGPPDAEAVSKAVKRFEDAYRRAQDPATRTTPAIDRKDQARWGAEKIIQHYYARIKNSHGISNANKLALGVRPLNRARTRIQCPQTSPCLGIVANTPGAQTLLFADSTTPNRRAKPFGAVGLELVREIHDGQPTGGPNDAQHVGIFTTNPIEVTFKGEHDRKRATYWGRWISRRGETGQWSLPISMSIAA